MLTVNDTSTNHTGKLGSDIVARDVFGLGTARFLAVDISLGGPAPVIVAVDVATGVATPIVPSGTYTVYDGALTITDAP